MTKEIAETPESELVTAVTSLTDVISELQKMIRDDYPKRNEIERDFVTKYGVKKRRIQFAVAIIVAIVASYFFTMGTISYCFLESPGTGGLHSKPLCELLPGYASVMDSSKDRLDVYQGVVERSLDNKIRLDKIEAELRGDWQ